MPQAMVLTKASFGLGFGVGTSLIDRLPSFSTIKDFIKKYPLFDVGGILSFVGGFVKVLMLWVKAFKGF